MASVKSWMHEVNDNLMLDGDISEDDKAFASMAMGDAVKMATQLGALIASREVHEHERTFESEAARATWEAERDQLDDTIAKTGDGLAKELEGADSTAVGYGMSPLMVHCGQTTLEGLGKVACDEFGSDYLDQLSAGKYVPLTVEHMNNIGFDIDVELGAPLDVDDMWEEEAAGDDYGYDI